MQKPQFHTLLVTIPAVSDSGKAIPKRVAMEYVRDAVRGWSGGGSPDDPYFKVSKKATVSGVPQASTKPSPTK